MISFLDGEIAEKAGARVVVDVAGVGYGSASKSCRSPVLARQKRRRSPPAEVITHVGWSSGVAG
jgi:Holliday junction resolvasome RuvABC DNA-binding subunit